MKRQHDKQHDQALQSAFDAAEHTPRAGFQDELRSRVMQADALTNTSRRNDATTAANKEPMNKRNLMKWLVASPLVAGAALAVVFGVRLGGGGDTTLPGGSQLSAQEVFANSIDNFFTTVRSDEVRYQRVRETYEYTMDGKTFADDSIMNIWTAGANERVDIYPVENPDYDYQTPTISSMRVFNDDASYLDCFYTLSDNLYYVDGGGREFDKGCEEIDPVEAWWNFVPADTYIDIQPSAEIIQLREIDHLKFTFTTDSKLEERHYIYFQENTDNGSVAGMLLDPAIEYYSLDERLLNQQNDDGTYTHYVNVSLEWATPMVRIQIVDENLTSAVYEVEGTTVTQLDASDINALYQSIQSESYAAISEEVENGYGELEGMLVEAVENGTLQNEETRVVDGREQLVVDYTVAFYDEDEGEVKYELTAFIDVETAAIEEVSIQYDFVDAGSVTLQIQEDTILDTPASEFFTEEYWENTRPE